LPTSLKNRKLERRKKRKKTPRKNRYHLASWNQKKGLIAVVIKAQMAGLVAGAGVEMTRRDKRGSHCYPDDQ
jgi:hypothetical protein